MYWYLRVAANAYLKLSVGGLGERIFQNREFGPRNYDCETDDPDTYIYIVWAWDQGYIVYAAIEEVSDQDGLITILDVRDYQRGEARRLDAAEQTDIAAAKIDLKNKPAVGYDDLPKGWTGK
jgi:hypothetical protein